jgi:hypothetical protein
MREKVYEIVVPSYTTDRRKRCTVYEIVFLSNIGGFKSSYSRIHRRYSEFYRLNSILLKFITTLPEFPRKVYYSNSERVKEERKMKFETYLKHIVELLAHDDGHKKPWGKEVILISYTTLIWLRLKFVSWMHDFRPFTKIV